ncbi:hypothetical protein B7463_g11899, partial [Scytalidium lignicola]
MNSSLKAELHRYLDDAVVDIATRQQRIIEVREYLNTLEEGLQTGSGTGGGPATLVPLRTLKTWSPVILLKGEFLMWDGDNYKDKTIETGQNLVKALAKVQFVVTWNCTLIDVTRMCPDIINLAGGAQAVESLLRSHVAKLRYRAKENASKLMHLQRHGQGASLRRLWRLDTALVLFGHLASAVNIQHIIEEDAQSIVGKWCSFIFQDLVENYNSAGGMTFLDKMPERAMRAGLECPSAETVPLTLSLLFLTRSSGRALTALSMPVPISVNEAVE